ncbi:MAG TPA: hypothetical protein VH186_34785 [Chloroflexia bacterium]|nr:hypothetical protein [Chloroflexia bacterium]
MPEYWLTDPEQHQAAFYRLGDQQHYQGQLPDQEGRYYSQTLAGFWLKPDWLWRSPLPRSTAVLKTVGGQAYRVYLDRLLQNQAEL